MKIYNLLIIPLILNVFLSCSNSEKAEDQLESQNAKMNISNETAVTDLWAGFPVYKEASLETTEECPGKWSNCTDCEHRVYLTNDDPALVCPFYKDEMITNGWMKLTYQYYPEGSCLATWMKNDLRVFLNIAKRKSDSKTVISVTLGRECP